VGSRTQYGGDADFDRIGNKSRITWQAAPALDTVSIRTADAAPRRYSDLVGPGNWPSPQFQGMDRLPQRADRSRETVWYLECGNWNGRMIRQQRLRLR